MKVKSKEIMSKCKLQTKEQGLYQSHYEHDACGVGMVVNIHGGKSHELVDNALKVLENMEHRGAETRDKTGDGAGIMIQIPHEFILLQGIPVPEKGKYGTDLDAAKDITGAFVSGLEESGITACVHDFPVSADTSAGSVIDESTSEMLVTGAYEIYKHAFMAGARAVMVSNAALPQLTGDNTPASLSSKIIQEELRGALNFDGVIVTGPLYEGAITESYTSDKAAVEALKAGADIIYLPEDFEAAYNGILSALQNGELTEDRINESISRIYRIKYAEQAEKLSGK